MTASLFNLAGPDLLIILIMAFGAIAVIGVLIMGGSFISRRSSQPPPPIPPVGSASDRLRQLDELKQKGSISDAEYEEQRHRILNSI